MRAFIRFGFFIFVGMFIVSGVVYAALSGADYNWLSTSSGGMLVKQSAGEGESEGAPVEDVLEFREDGSKIAFLDDDSKIDFQGKGYISEFDSFFLRERLHIRHDTALDFETGEDMSFTCGDACTMFAPNFLLLSLLNNPYKGGGVFVNNQDHPTLTLNDNLANLLALQGSAGIGAYDCLEGEVECEEGHVPRCYAGLDVGTETGIHGQTRQRDLILTAFDDPYSVYDPMQTMNRQIQSSLDSEATGSAEGGDFFASLIDLKDKLRRDIENNIAAATLQSTRSVTMDGLFGAVEFPDKISELYLYRTVEGESGPEDDDKDARLIAYKGDAYLWAGVHENYFVVPAVVMVKSDGNVIFQAGDDQ